MKLVFLAGPFRGDGSEEAKQQRIVAAKQQADCLVKNSISFYSPHLNLSQLLVQSGSAHEEYAIRTQKEFLMRCDILAVLPNWEESSGTKDEIEWAKQQEMPIVYLEENDAIETLKSLIS